MTSSSPGASHLLPGSVQLHLNRYPRHDDRWRRSRHAPVDKPLMVPKPAPPASAEAAEPASKPEPKPRAKTPKMAGAKKTAAAGTADVAKPKPAPNPRARKPKEQTP